jgi:hypothetical protein
MNMTRGSGNPAMIHGTANVDMIRDLSTRIWYRKKRNMIRGAGEHGYDTGNDMVMMQMGRENRDMINGTGNADTIQAAVNL